MTFRAKNQWLPKAPVFPPTYRVRRRPRFRAISSVDLAKILVSRAPWTHSKTLWKEQSKTKSPRWLYWPLRQLSLFPPGSPKNQNVPKKAVFCETERNWKGLFEWMRIHTRPFCSIPFSIKAHTLLFSNNISRIPTIRINTQYRLFHWGFFSSFFSWGFSTKTRFRELFECFSTKALRTDKILATHIQVLRCFVLDLFEVTEPKFRTNRSKNAQK